MTVLRNREFGVACMPATERDGLMRLIVLLSGGYEEMDLESFLLAASYSTGCIRQSPRRIFYQGREQATMALRHRQ
jgi:hypothetical protein